MKRGRYFDIPESPSEVEDLWARAQPLSQTKPPDWLDSSRYRSLPARAHAPTADNRDDYLAEVRELEGLNILVGSEKCSDGRLYVGAPWWDQIWSIGIYRGDSLLGLEPVGHGPAITRDDVRDVAAAFVADPFMIRAAGVWHMFFEVMNWRTGRGQIALALSDEAVHWAYQQVVLAEPFHLSYPYVFEWDGAYYMVPETYQAGGVRLYRADPFPHRWSPVRTLIEYPYIVDPSPFRFADRWWMFAATGQAGSGSHLNLFYADVLEGPWTPHPRNPLVSDVRSARPAGRVQIWENRLVRFGQVCAPDYGTAVRAFRIDELTTRDYHESEIDGSPLLGPTGSDWNADGVHHIDAHAFDGEWIACVDGWRRTPGMT
jgi:hypothetical protein